MSTKAPIVVLMMVIVAMTSIIQCTPRYWRSVEYESKETRIRRGVNSNNGCNYIKLMRDQCESNCNYYCSVQDCYYECSGNWCHCTDNLRRIG
ncbi:hypothetical protein F8203_gp158 [Heliothis virescens ascovirus 3f]|uniref:Uncharacterized protein n=1 Tax=Heliothis virescens ascovirus 3f TaxID=328614 RepID=A0A171PVP1_9VIRU|nr:hypothetical protein F8203_gp158 [Heliothis virescens ascovirus 3f]AJP09124.1 hypothetical protein [Heliothis virescens ascovirus 3f]